MAGLFTGGTASALARDRYDRVAQSFHWLVVLLVVAQYATKWVPAGFASLSEGWLNAWHLAIGPTILLLMLLRLAWRLTHHTPPRRRTFRARCSSCRAARIGCSTPS